MNEEKLKKWVENFTKEMDSVQVSFDAYFIQKQIDSYYSLKIDREHNNLLLEMKNTDELPNEIVTRITNAFEKSKPE